MFEIFNMGVGFCYVVAPDEAALTISILENMVASRNPSAMPSQIPSGMSGFTNESYSGFTRPFKTKIDPFAG